MAFGILRNSLHEAASEPLIAEVLCMRWADGEMLTLEKYASPA